MSAWCSRYTSVRCVGGRESSILVGREDFPSYFRQCFARRTGLRDRMRSRAVPCHEYCCICRLFRFVCRRGHAEVDWVARNSLKRPYSRNSSTYRHVYALWRPDSKSIHFPAVGRTPEANPYTISQNLSIRFLRFGIRPPTQLSGVLWFRKSLLRVKSRCCKITITMKLQLTTLQIM